MSTVQVTVFHGIDGAGKTKSYDLPTDLSACELLVRITHSGLCGTDSYFLHAGCALGHEGIGVVEKVGSNVTNVKVGDRVGGGYLRSSCGNCKFCLNGQDIWCAERDIYGESSYDKGTFGTYYKAREGYVHKIPDDIPSEYAAPLQCAGATVYSALRTYYKPGMRIGVLGIGGLGHLAVQYASKFGADTVVFSSTTSKEKEARLFGASEFILLGDLQGLTAPVDLMLITAHAAPDWNKFLNSEVIARTGIIIPLGVLGEKLEVPFLPFFMNGYNIDTSLVASRSVHAEMLDFSARHGIKPTIETFEMTEEGFAEALKKLKDGSIRYRAVLAV